MGVPAYLPDDVRVALASTNLTVAVAEPVAEPVVDQVAQTIEQEDVPVARAAALIEESLKPVPEVVEEEEPEVEDVPADKALL